MLRTSNLDGTVWNLLRRIKYGVPKAYRNWKYRRAVKWIYKSTEMHVFAGPFKGMLVSDAHVYGAPVAKLLGTYEKELHPTFQQIISKAPPHVIDVGGAEGYYAIGMAMQSMVGSVLVWESLETGRNMIERFAKLNNVLNKMEIRGECSEAGLYEVLSGQQSGLMIMDVEGAELDLLSERVCSALGKWDVVVESHDMIKIGCTDKLVNMLEPTHDIRLIQTAERLRDDFPLPMKIDLKLKKWLMDEGRPGAMYWVIGTPKNERADVDMKCTVAQD